MLKINQNWIYNTAYASTCFFRSSLNPPELKVMIQITERCNLNCKHCFLSATDTGCDLSLQDFTERILPKLVTSNTKKVTLTGGEPFVNNSMLSMIQALYDAGIQTCICTNASLISKPFLQSVATLNVHFNVSLDGMASKSHGEFRGFNDQKKFLKILENINLIGEFKMLNGILTTPNKLTSIEEYIAICDFAEAAGAHYFLMNPLSPLGRGKFASDLVLTKAEMVELKNRMHAHITGKNYADFEIVYIRFPNTEGKELSRCCAGAIPYVFTNGDIAVCPYLVFASENSDNSYARKEFIIGNIFDDINLAKVLEQYKSIHKFCQFGEDENLGCAAMKISRGVKLSCEDIL